MTLLELIDEVYEKTHVDRVEIFGIYVFYSLSARIV